jgi:ribonuclease HI
MLGGCKKGAPPDTLRTAVLACVIPTMAYAAETWWLPPGGQGHRFTTAVAAMDRACRIALRAALPVYRTTPAPLLHHAAGIPPMECHLDNRSRMAAVRFARLDTGHPLRARIRAAQPGCKSRLARTAFLPPGPVERTNPIAYPPWTPSESRSLPPLATWGNSKAVENQAAKFAEWRAGHPPLDLWVFTDGSKLADGRAGAGWELQLTSGLCIASGRAPLGPHQEVFDAEAAALGQGLSAALDTCAARWPGNLWACLDNSAVAEMVYGLPVGTSQRRIQRAQRLLDEWMTRARAPQGCTAHVLWVPGHVGIPGNEAADREAGGAAALPPDQHPPAARMSLAAARRWAREALEEDFRTWWARLPARTPTLPPPTPKTPPWLKMLRPTLARLLAARSGHGDFAAYHERWAHEDAQMMCACGARTAPDHFLQCPRLEEPELLADARGRVTFEHVVGTVKGAKAFGVWVAATRYFS